MFENIELKSPSIIYKESFLEKEIKLKYVIQCIITEIFFVFFLILLLFRKDGF